MSRSMYEIGKYTVDGNVQIVTVWYRSGQTVTGTR
jgi:hypothetical protein